MTTGPRRSWPVVALLAGLAASGCTVGAARSLTAAPPSTSAAPPTTPVSSIAAAAPAPAPVPTSAATTAPTRAPVLPARRALAAPPPTPPAPAAHFAVGVHAETFVDTTRPTPATSAGPAAPARVLPTTIWYPAAGHDSGEDVVDAAPAVTAGPFPLVVWGHGFDVRAADYRRFLHRWAQAGYVIAAPDFPASTSGRSGPGAGPATTDDEGSEPGDLTFAAGAVFRLSAARGGLLAGLVEPQHLIAAGHSQGAADALAMTLAQCCRDSRVSAAVIVAGAERPDRFGAYRYASTHTPVFLEQGDRDRYLNVDGARRLYRHLSAPKLLLVMRGADHNTSQEDAATDPTALLAEAVVDFCNHYVKGDRGGPPWPGLRASPLADLTTAP